MDKMNWAILGPGTIAADFAKSIANVNGSVYAIGSRNIEEAKKFAEDFNVQKFYGNYSEMLEDEKIDIVYISTPHSNHYEYIIESLKKNKHVLCEKAITVNGNQLREIVDLANKKNLVVAEAMTIYHMPLYKKLRELINCGKLGKIKMIQVSFGSLKEYDVNNRFFSQDLAGGALLDIGTYALSFTRYFLSSYPNEILTMRAKQPKKGVIAGELGYITVDDFPRADKATFTYPDGKVELIEAGDAAKDMSTPGGDMSFFYYYFK